MKSKSPFEVTWQVLVGDKWWNRVESFLHLDLATKAFQDLLLRKAAQGDIRRIRFGVE